MFVLGVTYATYIAYALMINTGTFQTVVDQVMAQVPEQVDSVYALASQIAVFSFADLGVAIVERIFAVMFHIGASIIVFYACKDKRNFWLHPLAILLHIAMDFIAGLTIAGVFNSSTWLLEEIVGIVGIPTFCGAYFLLFTLCVSRKKHIFMSQMVLYLQCLLST